MKYFLIIIVYHVNSVSVQKVDFNSKASCEYVAQDIVKNIPSHYKISSTKCYPTE